MQNLIKTFIFLFKRYSPLRIFQIIEANKVFIKGKSLEFGAYKNQKKLKVGGFLVTNHGKNLKKNGLNKIG